jgi:hypothetical protein
MELKSLTTKTNGWLMTGCPDALMSNTCTDCHMKPGSSCGKSAAAAAAGAESAEQLSKRLSQTCVTYDVP